MSVCWVVNQIELRRFYRSLIQNSDKFISLCPEYNEELAEELGLSQSDIEKLDYVYNRINLEESPKLEKENLIVLWGVYLIKINTQNDVTYLGENHEQAP